MTPEQTVKAGKYIERSLNTLAEADALLQAGLAAGAVNRAYYACFYAAHGLLIAKGLEPKTHTAVRELLSREFVRDGQLDRSVARLYMRLFDMRQSGDYDVSKEIPIEHAARWSGDARLFVDTINALTRQRLEDL